MSRLGLEAIMSRLGHGRFGPRSSSEGYIQCFFNWLRIQIVKIKFKNHIFAAMIKQYHQQLVVC